MHERDWREVLLVVALIVAVLTQVGPVLFVLFHDAPSLAPLFPETPGVDYFERLARFRALQPGFYLLAVAALVRITPRGVVRSIAGWVCVIGAAAGLVSVIGQWYLELTGEEPQEFPIFGAGRGVSHVATLVMILAVAWWGWEALRVEPEVVPNDPA